MQRSAKSTEAIYLLMKEAFALGYRRVVWTCSNANQRSKRSALRLGFTYEGVRRQARVGKSNTNFDDCYFAIMDGEWSLISRAFECWLSDENMVNGGQVRTLQKCVSLAEVGENPPTCPS